MNELKWDNITKWVLWGTAIVWIIWDVVISGKGHTESQMIAEFARKFVTAPFVFGILMGHWFFNRKTARYELWPVFVGLIVLVGLFDGVWHWTMHESRAWYRWPGIWLVLGIPVGSFFFPQRDPEAPL